MIGLYSRLTTGHAHVDSHALSTGAKKHRRRHRQSKQENRFTSKSMQKIATVTGGARGIGLATVKRFLADGWRVALLDIDEETLNRSAAYLSMLTPFYRFTAMLPTPRELQKHLARSRKNLAGSMSWSTMRASRSSNRYSMSHMRSGRACWRSTSPDRSYVLRPRLH